MQTNTTHADVPHFTAATNRRYVFSPSENAPTGGGRFWGEAAEDGVLTADAAATDAMAAATADATTADATAAAGGAARDAAAEARDALKTHSTSLSTGVADGVAGSELSGISMLEAGGIFLGLCIVLFFILRLVIRIFLRIILVILAVAAAAALFRFFVPEVYYEVKGKLFPEEVLNIKASAPRRA